MSDVKQTTPAVRSEADRPQRAQRIPFGVKRQKLGVAMEIPGYHLRWINDDGVRIMQAQQGGYMFVTPAEVGLTDKDSQVKRLVGKTETGAPLYAYLMKLEQAFYEEDRQIIQKEVDKFDTAIKSGSIEARPGDNRYNAGIKIT